MLTEVYNKNCVQILVDDKKNYFVRYDGGGFVTDIREIELSREEANFIMELDDAMRIALYLCGPCYDRWKNSRGVMPSEYVGDTVKLMMGKR